MAERYSMRRFNVFSISIIIILYLMFDSSVTCYCEKKINVIRAML